MCVLYSCSSEAYRQSYFPPLLHSAAIFSREVWESGQRSGWNDLRCLKWGSEQTASSNRDCIGTALVLLRLLRI